MDMIDLLQNKRKFKDAITSKLDLMRAVSIVKKEIEMKKPINSNNSRNNR